MVRQLSVLLVGWVAAGCGVNQAGMGHGRDASIDAPAAQATTEEVGTETPSVETGTAGGPDRAPGLDGVLPGDGGPDDEIPSGSLVDGSSYDRPMASPEAAASANDDDGGGTAVDAAVDGMGGDGPPAVEDAPDLATDASQEAGSPACNAPVCYADLRRDCEPAGQCFQQTSGYDTAQCYANGVRVFVTVDTKAATKTTLVMRGTRICYRLHFDLVALIEGAPVVGHIEDGSGATVATIGDDVSGRSTVTCNGGAPVALNQACDLAISVGASCDPGSCTP